VFIAFASGGRNHSNGARGRIEAGNAGQCVMRPHLAVLVICALASVITSAQVRYRPTETGPWRPWSFTAIASARQARAATTAEVQAFQARLQELAAIVKRAPAVAQPLGFAAELWGSLDGYSPSGPGQPSGKSVPLAGALSFGAFPLIEFTRNGKLMNEDLKGGETQLLQFAVNRIEMGIYSSSRPMEWGQQEIEGFFEPKAGEPISGLPRVDDVLIVKKNPKPLWVPVPFAEALQPVITERRLLFENRRDVYAKEVEQLARTKFSDPAIEKMQRSRLAAGGPEDRGVREAERELLAVTSLLESLTPDRRSAPSCYQPNAASLAEKFRTAAGAPPACRALVKPNWGYFDPALPRSSPQVLMVSTFTRCLTAASMAEKNRGGCVINRELISSLDWDAVRGWLDK
jgi:hypothetical protein